ncbi:MAG: DUF3792 family protein [Bacilli bacterium]|nr:DUF3792 family protein [Bacilli bacterium]
MLNISFNRGDIIKYLKYLLLTIITISLILIIITILNYYNLIDDNSFKILKLLNLLIVISTYSYLLANNYQKKKYLIGIKFSLLIIIFLFIPSLIIHSFKLKTLIYYFIIISISIISSIFSKKKRIS